MTDDTDRWYEILGLEPGATPVKIWGQIFILDFTSPDRQGELVLGNGDSVFIGNFEARAGMGSACTPKRNEETWGQIFILYERTIS